MRNKNQTHGLNCKKCTWWSILRRFTQLSQIVCPHWRDLHQKTEKCQKMNKTELLNEKWFRPWNMAFLIKQWLANLTREQASIHTNAKSVLSNRYFWIEQPKSRLFESQNATMSSDDLFSCEICFLQFDDTVHIPKFGHLLSFEVFSCSTYFFFIPLVFYCRRLLKCDHTICESCVNLLSMVEFFHFSYPFICLHFKHQNYYLPTAYFLHFFSWCCFVHL